MLKIFQLNLFRNVEERVRNTEWFTRVKDTKVNKVIYSDNRILQVIELNIFMCNG